MSGRRKDLHPTAVTHFRVAKEPKSYRWPRGICGIGGAAAISWSTTMELREAAIVECPQCMVLKDAWLALPKRKPLTIRRVREFAWGNKVGGK